MLKIGTEFANMQPLSNVKCKFGSLIALLLLGNQQMKGEALFNLKIYAFSTRWIHSLNSITDTPFCNCKMLRLSFSLLCLFYLDM